MLKVWGTLLKGKRCFTVSDLENSILFFLQETHLSEQESQKLCKDWVGHVFYSIGSSQSNGVITLVNKNLQFKCISEKCDTEGRIIVTLVELQGRLHILAKTYAPNGDDPNFFAALEGILSVFGDYPIIWARDMNVVLDTILDRSQPGSMRPPKSVFMLKQVYTSLDLIDAWRLLNPSGRDYTFFSSPHNTYSRID